MSVQPLVSLRAAAAFDPQPTRRQLHELHVPFDELVGGHSCEDALAIAVRSGDRVSLMGPSGSGKSSVMSHVFRPEVKGLAAMPIAVSIEDPDVSRDPFTFAGHVLATVERWLGEQLPGEAPAGTSSAERTTERSHRISAELEWLAGANIGYELRQVVEERPASGAEKVAAVVALLATIASHQLTPVLVFDDTDKWTRRPNAEESEDLRRGFFGGITRLIAEELGCAAVVATHPTYVDDASYAAAQGMLSQTIRVPRLPDEVALRRLLDHRAALVLRDDTALCGDLLDDGGIARVWEHYSSAPSSDVRGHILLVLHTALTTAVDTGSDRFGEHLVMAAIADSLGG